MAFGTGQHPTTAMCLRALEERVRGGDDVLDLGTGSGILAVAAAKLGACRVLALDTDPQAVKAARDNAAANRVGDVVEVWEGTLPESAAGERFDVIVANISGLTLERLAPSLAGALKSEGALIISGFLEDAVAALDRTFGEVGLSVEGVEADGVWRTMIAGKSDNA
jgi:ribosomal protein L11 methyltransferase